MVEIESTTAYLKTVIYLLVFRPYITSNPHAIHLTVANFLSRESVFVCLGYLQIYLIYFKAVLGRVTST